MADLWIEDRIKNNDFIELAARFESRSISQRLWYRVEASREIELSTSADPFLLGILQIAMNAGEPLQVHGQVSPSLLINLEKFQRAWATWVPDKYKFIEVRADDEREPELPDRSEAIMCFSGGVDSCFTAYRHAKGILTRFPQPVTSAILVHGFDIPLCHPDYYQSALKKVNYQVNSLGIQVYQLETNFKEISVFWPHAYGSGLASILSLFHKKYAKGLIAQTVPYSSYENLTEGSNPLTDPLLSSKVFPVVTDAAGFQRLDKIEVISKWPEGMKYLRVCWEGDEKDSNCCDCEKCIRNILTFRALGLPLPSVFPKDVSDDRIFRLGPLKEFTISIGYNVILDFAEKNGMGNTSWVDALKKAIHRSRAIRKLSSTPLGRFKLGVIRLFNSVWRQPVSRTKF